MHKNFYHWHTQAAVEPPDVSVLEARWAAAAKFPAKASADDIIGLLRLAILPYRDSEFNKKYSDELVKAEPTFTAERNGNLLRVMAAASLSSKLEFITNVATSIALGIRAADFPSDRVEPICTDLVSQADLYCVSAAEYYRPKLILETITSAEKKIDTSVATLKEAFVAGDTAKMATTIESFSKNLVTSLKESHGHIGRVIGRYAEESQAMWWLVGKRSSELNSRRQILSPLSYALAAAYELASRVSIPPPASARDLLEEVLSQCLSSGKSEGTLADVISSAPGDFIQRVSQQPVDEHMMPVSFSIWEFKTKGKLTAVVLKEIGLSTKARFDANQVSVQYFRELAFARAILEVK